MSKNSKKLKRYIRKQIKKYVKENNIFVFTKLPEKRFDLNGIHGNCIPRHTSVLPNYNLK